VGALLLLAIVIGGCVYAYRWWRAQKRHWIVAQPFVSTTKCCKFLC